jgi:hypothetical protein
LEKKKLFSKETLRERAAITVALNSWPSGRSALFFVGANQPEGREIKGLQGATGDRVKEHLVCIYKESSN